MRRMIFDFGSEKVRMGVQGSKRPPYTMPAVVAHRPPGEVVAVGEEALHMVGRTPADIETERPFGRGGVLLGNVSNPDRYLHAWQLVTDFISNSAKR